MANGKVTTKRKLSRLKEHPMQAAMFGDVSDAELDALAADLKKNGQRHPVEILPDRTVIAGHQRVRAARKLGWDEIEVVVRHDLAEAGPAAVEELLISDNFVRRQLSPLARARCAKRLLEIELGDRSYGLTGRGLERLKAEVGQRLNIDARSVNRYLRVLGTPAAVQHAFDRGELNLVVAERVAGLAPHIREKIAKRISAGETPKAVVAEYLPESAGRHVKPRDAWASSVRAFETVLHDLEDRIDKIPIMALKEHVGLLRRVRKLVRLLRERADQPPPQKPDLARLADLYRGAR